MLCRKRNEMVINTFRALPNFWLWGARLHRLFLHFIDIIIERVVKVYAMERFCLLFHVHVGSLGDVSP